MNGSSYSLIIGSGGGLGEALALDLASRGWNLVLASKSLEKMEELRDEILAQYKVFVELCQIDGANAEDVNKIFSFMIINKIRPEILINNAACAEFGEFAKNSFISITKTLELNAKFLTLCIYRFMEYKRGETFRILNIASSYAFRSSPKYAVYGATKAYVYRLSRSLQAELKNSDSTVSVMCSGKIATDFDLNSGNKNTISRKGSDPNKIAKITIEGLLKGKSLILPGFANKARRIAFALFDLASF
jgi:short-subunit dehydrogenase